MKVASHRVKYYVLAFSLLIIAVWEGVFSAPTIAE